MALSDEQRDDILISINKNVKDLTKRVAHIETELVVIKQDVNWLKQDMGVVKQDINGLKQDMGVMKEDINGLKQDVSEIKQELATKPDEVRVRQIVREELDKSFDQSLTETTFRLTRVQ